MLKAVKEVQAVLEMTRGTPFFAHEVTKAMGALSKDHASAVMAIVGMQAIQLDCGRVVLPA